MARKTSPDSFLGGWVHRLLSRPSIKDSQFFVAARLESCSIVYRKVGVFGWEASPDSFLADVCTDCYSTDLSRIVRSLSQLGLRVVQLSVETWVYSGGSIWSINRHV